MSPTNHYAHIDYRKMIAWPKRLEREWTFLSAPLGSLPSNRLLDLGCGSGEHARYLAGKGFEVVGVDVSDTMLERAREDGVPAGVQFLLGDLIHVESVVTGKFGGAVCLGNTLAHIMDQETLTQLFKGVRAVLLPGAPLVIQVLNYERLVHSGQRCLPLTFIQDEEGEAIFLRVMTHHEDGSVTFTPSLLRYRKDGDPALEVISSHNVPLRGWKRAEMEAALNAAGFTARELFGTMGHVPYEDHDSTDLVVIAR
ncbi:MAG: Methyltransferase type 11 [Acidobacteria bacterium]|nr:Methyltransferase type 11 [Acidobacteriota bacterium]